MNYREPFPHDDPDVLSKKWQRHLENIPANVLKPDARAHVRLLFFRLPTSAAKAKKFLRQAVRRGFVTTALQQCRQSLDFRLKHLSGEPFRSIALSASGFHALQIEPIRQPPDLAFKNGMKHSQELHALGDRLESVLPGTPVKPADWQPEYRETTYDGVWLLAHADKGEADCLAGQMECFGADFDVEILHREIGTREEREPFGFLDGLSTPQFFANRAPVATPQRWPHVFPLRSVLLTSDDNKGHFNEQGREVDLSVYNSGSFLVFRKLEQDVAAFDAAVAEIGGKMGRSPADVGALIVGRHKDGRSLITPASGKNDFDYVDDTIPTVCPFHSHIRKANPREIPPSGPVHTERIIARRGANYESVDEAGKKTVGLLFMAYGGTIENGFRFIQSSWINQEDFMAGTTGNAGARDALLGHPASPDLIFGGNRYSGLQQFVIPRGGEYFFVPPTSWLRNPRTPPDIP